MNADCEQTLSSALSSEKSLVKHGTWLSKHMQARYSQEVMFSSGTKCFMKAEIQYKTVPEHPGITVKGFPACFQDLQKRWQLCTGSQGDYIDRGKDHCLARANFFLRSLFWNFSDKGCIYVIISFSSIKRQLRKSALCRDNYMPWEQGVDKGHCATTISPNMTCRGHWDNTEFSGQVLTMTAYDRGKCRQ